MGQRCGEEETDEEEEEEEGREKSANSYSAGMSHALGS